MKVTIIGLGYVGLTAAANLADMRHDVVALDTDKQKIQALNTGEMVIYEPGLQDMLRNNLDTIKFLHTDDFSEDLGEIVLITVGTPSAKDGSVDLSQVNTAMEWVLSKASSPLTIVMKSTVPPGTGLKLKADYLINSQIRIGYVSNPEFLREGQAIHDWKEPDRIVIGSDDVEAINTVNSLYEGIKSPVINTDITSSEMIKYAANAFLATKISFINEVANLSDKVNAHIDDVVNGIAADPRIGSNFLSPGLGYGGSCFPKDISSLEHLSMVHKHDFELLRSVISVNTHQRNIPIEILKKSLGTLQSKTVGILGLSYKPGTDDIRDAPSLDIIHNLLKQGATVQAFDPVAMSNAKGELGKTVTFTNTSIETINGANAIILVTEWAEFIQEIDWGKAYHTMLSPALIFDGRNVLDGKALKSMGFQYKGIGKS